MPQKTPARRETVGIVGAGLAGLAAAYYLTRKTEQDSDVIYDVTIFEAGDRLGGRVRTETSLECESGPKGFRNIIPGAKALVRSILTRAKTISLPPIEFGAELIGANHTIWLTLAKRFGLSLNKVTSDDDFSLAGLHTLANISSRPSSLCHKTLFEEIDRALITLNRNAARIDTYAPWGRRCVRETVLPRKEGDPPAVITVASPWGGDNLTVKLYPNDSGYFYENFEFDCFSVQQWIDDLPDRQFSADTKSLLAFNLENTQTVKPSDQSYLGLLAAVKAGALNEDLATSANPSKYWTHSEYFRCSNGNVELARALHGEGMKCEHLRVRTGTPIDSIEANSEQATVSVGERREAFDWVVLAAPGRDFTISINEEKKRYQARALRNVLSRDGVLEICGYDLISGSDKDNEKRIQFGSATKYLSEIDSPFWVKAGLAPSGVDTGLGAFWEATDGRGALYGYVLTLFGGGKYGEHIVQLRNQPNLLNSEIAERYNGFKPVRNKVCDWTNEPWIYPGYSCPGPRDVTRIGPLLQKPHGRLVFAGEHTSMGFFGYMEGALYSGLRAAREIARKTIKV